VAMAPPTVGKQVFLRVTTATTTVMRGMTSEDTTGQKAADGRKKSPAVAGKKTDAYCPCKRKEADRQWPANAAFQTCFFPLRWQARTQTRCDGYHYRRLLTLRLVRKLLSSSRSYRNRTYRLSHGDNYES